MRPAYQRETPIRDRMADVETSASSGWIFCENTSLVSQPGCMDASQAERACACRRSDSACLARASGFRAAARPIFAALTRRLVAVLTAQLAQWVRLSAIAFPQPRQRFSSRGATSAVDTEESPFASRLWVCVKRVGGKLDCVLLRVVDHNCCVTHSATGPTARDHMPAVSDRRMANDAIKRQFPSRCSKNQSRRNG